MVSVTILKGLTNFLGHIHRAASLLLLHELPNVRRPLTQAGARKCLKARLNVLCLLDFFFFVINCLRPTRKTRELKGLKWTVPHLCFDFHFHYGSNYCHEVADNHQDIPSIDELPPVRITYLSLVLLQEEL